MTPRNLFLKSKNRKLLIIILPVFVSVLLGGCSIRPVTYDELLYYDEDEYYDEYYGAGYRQDYVKYEDYNYRAWQMSQYYRYNEPGYQAYVDANRENNVDSSSGNYRSGETPVRQAPNQPSQGKQRIQSNRVRQRKDGENQKLVRENVRDFQSEIGEEQRSKAEKRRREEMKRARSKRKRKREKDEELTEEELEKQRQETRRKKRKR